MPARPTAVARRRAGTVYVDYLQNVVAKPVAAASCVRATPEATVSTPLACAELDDALDPRAFTIATLPTRLATVGDPWDLPPDAPDAGDAA